MAGDDSPAASDLSVRPAKLEVPKSFELYVDGAKWLLAIVAGLLAYGFEAVKDRPGDISSLVLFGLYAACLSATGACALYYLLMSFTFLSRREGGKPSDHPDVVSARMQSNIAFYGMLLSFASGLLLFVGFGAAQVLAFRHTDDLLKVHLGAAVVVQRGERLWMLTERAGTTARWQLLAPVPVEDAALANRRAPPLTP